MKRDIIICIIVVLFLIFAIFAINKFLSQDTKTANSDDKIEIVTLQKFIPQNVNKVKIIISSEGNEYNNFSDTVYFLSDLDQISSFIDYYNNIEISNPDSNDIADLLYEINLHGDTDSVFKVYSNNLININNENNFYKISNNSLNKIGDSTDVKFYLHDSDLEKPSSDNCYKAQSTILSNVSQNDISTLKYDIHNVHSSLEYNLVDYVNTIKDANSIYWEPATKNEVFTQPNGVSFQSYGLWEYRDTLKNLLNLKLSNEAETIINDILLHLQTGMDNHDLSECFEAHKILHDFDYWCVNYPISLKVEPADWGGLNCYYGLIENYNL